MKLSVCVPTYNRAGHLANCLESIRIARERAEGEVQVCVSDNASTDDTATIVAAMAKKMSVDYRRNETNLGAAKNYLKAVEPARGEFVWLLGDDDLLRPDALDTALRLLAANPSVDYFFVNASRVDAEFVLGFPQPFDTTNLPAELPRFSPRLQEGPLPFFDLVDPDVSFDFLLGIFLSVFRREAWVKNAGVLDDAAVSDTRHLSTFDNTCPHLKIFAKAFARSTAYFHPGPLTACLTGAREWAPLYPFLRSVRLIEALDEYRKNGLPEDRYRRCKNRALAHLLPDLANMFVHRDASGWAYADLVRILLSAAPYPNAWLSPLYYAARKLGAAAGVK
ncbi:MAG: glycosyltransferase family 2 protein [Elusimicrobiota bacterium]|nr:glycosyltransferase family 2 protein [Elusimicrobiota bacterium]